MIPTMQLGGLGRRYMQAGSGPPDPYFANVVAGLHLDGADGSTTFTDVKGNSWSNAGTANVIDTAQSKFGGASLGCVGVGHYIESTHADYTLGSGDWTIEIWHRCTDLTGFRGVVDFRPASTEGVYPTLYHNGTTLVYHVSSATRISGGTLASGVWKHLAVCKASGTTRMFIDGTQVGSNYTDSNNYLGTRIRLANFGNNPNGGINGNLDDFRLTKGVARYTSNFTPPLAAFPDS